MIDNISTLFQSHYQTSNLQSYNLYILSARYNFSLGLSDDIIFGIVYNI